MDLFRSLGCTTDLQPITYALFWIKLESVKEFLSKHNMQDEATTTEATRLCFDVLESHVAPTACRARANYYLGLIELRNVRRSGDLYRLWSGHSNLNDAPQFCSRSDIPRAITRARHYFFSTLSGLGPASDLLARDALRSLALVTGPHDATEPVSSSAFSLLHTSIGSRPRQIMARTPKHAECLDEKCFDLSGHTAGKRRLQRPFSVFDSLDVPFAHKSRAKVVDELFGNFQKYLPADWRIVGASICPTGELLLTSMSNDPLKKALNLETVCVFPKRDEHGDYSCGAYDGILKPFESIMRRNDEQLQSFDSKDPSRNIDHSCKTTWWKQRKELDEIFHNMLNTVEKDWFHSDPARRVLRGNICSTHEDFDRSDNESESELNDDLAANFDVSWLPDDGSDIGDKSVEEIYEELTERGIEKSASSKTKRADLIQAKKNSYTVNAMAKSRTFTLLILDENLHRFPFESLPSLAGHRLSRLPSLPFAIAKLLESRDENFLRLQGSKTSYIVDPEANLPGTTNRLLPYLESLSEKNEREWIGLVREVPTADFFRDALSRNGLLLYFGHGNGQAYFSKSDIEKVGRRDESGSKQDTASGIRAAVILMGCSSGKIESVNRQHSQVLEELPIHYEPEGVALSYLLAGAPCIVGTLWDVTDGDIDRFAIDMLERFFNDDVSSSLAECVDKARSACKMRYLVGCAPVCYGFPVSLSGSNVADEDENASLCDIMHKLNFE